MDKQLSLHFMVRDELMRMESIVRQMENELVKLPKGSIAKKNKKFYHIYRENSVKYMKAVKEEKQLEQLRTRREIKKALPVLPF